jgi:hypothetical protein
MQCKLSDIQSIGVQRLRMYCGVDETEEVNFELSSRRTPLEARRLHLNLVAVFDYTMKEQTTSFMKYTARRRWR